MDDFFPPARHIAQHNDVEMTDGAVSRVKKPSRLDHHPGPTDSSQFTPPPITVEGGHTIRHRRLANAHLHTANAPPKLLDGERVPGQRYLTAGVAELEVDPDNAQHKPLLPRFVFEVSRIGQKIDGRSALHDAVIAVFKALQSFFCPVWDPTRLPYSAWDLVYTEKSSRPWVVFNDPSVTTLWLRMSFAARFHAVLCFIDTYKHLVNNNLFAPEVEFSIAGAPDLVDPEAFNDIEPKAVVYPREDTYWQRASHQSKTIGDIIRRALPYHIAEQHAQSEDMYIIAVLDAICRYELARGLHAVFHRIAQSEPRGLSTRAFAKQLAEGKVDVEIPDRIVQAVWSNATPEEHRAAAMFVSRQASRIRFDAVTQELMNAIRADRHGLTDNERLSADDELALFQEACKIARSFIAEKCLEDVYVNGTRVFESYDFSTKLSIPYPFITSPPHTHTRQSLLQSKASDCLDRIFDDNPLVGGLAGQNSDKLCPLRYHPPSSFT